jgi:two-component system sensor histidine kinase VicK
VDTNFFKNLPGKYKIPFRDYYTGQNLVSVRTASIVFLILNVLIRVLSNIFPIRLTRAENFPEFNIANWIFIGTSVIICITSYYLVGEYRRHKRATAIMSLFIFCFALYIVMCGMYSSFISSLLPSNAVTLYLIALMVISIVCVLEYYETVLLIVAAELFFSAFLIGSHIDPTNMIYNQLVSVVLLTGFFLISRYSFSYKANYYLQLIEINEKNLKIEQGSEFKSQLLGTVAHDLRNPIAAVESIAMLMEMDDIDDDTQENLNLMKASCVKARTIIDDLLESARNENTLQFITQKVELNKLLNNIINVWNIQTEEKNNVLLVSSMSPAYAAVNHERFTRVVDNLIGNALKFSKEDSKVEVCLYKFENEIILEVKDNGMGIPKDMQPLIFLPFSKAGRAGLRGEKSTGLGLSIVKQIIEKHKGRIEVESEEGKGSTFRIILPEWTGGPEVE